MQNQIFQGFFRKIWFCITLNQLFLANICGERKGCWGGHKEWGGRGEWWGWGIRSGDATGEGGADKSSAFHMLR